MRTLAVGDIHGCSAALDALLNAVALEPDDTLITLGDYVDRGLDSPGVLDRLISLSRQYHVVCLRGNHDQMMLNARAGGEALQGWRMNGGDITEEAYGGLDAVPDAHWRFLQDQCLDIWETETHFFVHAGVYADIPLLEQPSYVLHWGRLDKAKPHESGKTMICGHDSQKNGLPLNLGFAVCLDTWAYGSGWLTCLDVATGYLWQANRAGHLRRMQLAAPSE